MKNRITNENEKIVWNYINKQRTGINEIVSATKISKPTIIKILQHFKELGLINYPSQQRGKRTLITVKEAEFNRIFTKLENTAKTYDEATVMPLIIKTKKGKTYCGSLDDYENRAIFLLDSHIFHKSKWSLIKNGSPMHELVVELSDIRFAYTVYPENIGLHYVSLSDVMNLWKDHSHNILTGVDCPWTKGDRFSEPIPHSKNCESKVHEALSDVYGAILWEIKLPKTQKEKLEKSMEFLIEYIVQKGGKIPWKSY